MVFQFFHLILLLSVFLPTKSFPRDFLDAFIHHQKPHAVFYVVDNDATAVRVLKQSSVVSQTINMTWFSLCAIGEVLPRMPTMVVANSHHVLDYLDFVQVVSFSE